MLLKRYTVIGINSSTGRRKTITVSAADDAGARNAAILRGLEPNSVDELPPFPPSEAQLQYAAKLGVIIPEGATIDDASAIISKAVDDDIAPSKDLVDFANHHGLKYSSYIGEQRLYDELFKDLGYIERISFFAFSVYRWLTGEKRNNLEIHPERQKFYDFAEQIKANQRIVDSILRYEGRLIRYFGRLIDVGENIHPGGSTNTIAYNETCDYLQSAFGISVSKKTQRIKGGNEGSVQTLPEKPVNKPGCLGRMMIIGLLLIFLILNCVPCQKIGLIIPLRNWLLFFILQAQYDTKY